jgi:trigger factor
MQVTETSSTGLKRELKVVIGQGELGERFASRIDEVKDQVQLKGFRKGKVPVSHIKKLFGRSVMAEVVQQAIDESSRKAISDRNERPAHQPTIGFGDDKDEMERTLKGEGDLAYTLSFEILPSITITDFSTLPLERLVAEVSDEAVDKAVADLVERGIRYEAEADRAAAMGDRLTMNYVGRVDGNEFEGGRADDAELVLGEGQLLPGLAEGLLGAKAGEERVVKARFPDEYPTKDLAGKDAEFAVAVKEVAKPVRPEVGDEFAQTLGANSLEHLKELLKGRIAAEYGSVTYAKLKRQVLDALDKAHDFALPESLVAEEVDTIQRRYKASRRSEDEGEGEPAKSEEELAAEFRRIAERRVRLGLVIGEIGERQKIEVTQDELKRALVARARSFPGQERAVYEFYEKNPAAVVELRAPIYEDKVIEHILEQAKPTDKHVSVEDLMAPLPDSELESEAAHAHDHDHGHDHDHHGHDRHDHDHHDHDHDHHGHDHGAGHEHGDKK